jgi:hypothetical protein
MTEAKTVQKIIRPVTVRCGAPGCTAKADAAVSSTGEGDADEVIAPRGWVFDRPHPQSTRDVIFGMCPAHAKG